MKKRILYLSILLVSLGCQKEVSIELPSTTPDPIQPSASPLLKKMVTRDLTTGFDYMTQEFSYDDSLRLTTVRETFKVQQQGVVETVTVSRFVRDRRGRIESIFTVRDTVTFRHDMVYADNSSDRVTEIKSFQVRGNLDLVTGKTVHQHNPAGLITKVSWYLPENSGNLREVKYLTMKYDAAGNLAEQSHYSDPDGNGTWDPSIRYVWTHDTNVNPRFFQEEALYFWGYYWTSAMSPSNTVLHLNKYPNLPEDEVKYVQSYNSRRLPVTERFSSGNNVAQITFYYD